MTPYYDDGHAVIYHGDCLAVMDVLCPDRLGSPVFDLLLTDPPYGIGAARRGRGGRQDGQALAPSVDYGDLDWDDAPALREVAAARAVSRHQIIFGGNYYDLPPARCWLVWDKENGANDYADCELAWTNLAKPVRRMVYRWQGMLQQPGRPKEQRWHPTQKPEPVMVWALGHAPANVQTVFDPFMGSGTTLVAAKRLGKRCVGIEREEKYCEIAAKRLSQGALPLEFSA